jgi:beta-galactosidase/beta-glucuronidase
MRKFSAGKDAKGHPRLMLNDQPYFFQGVLDQGYWPESLYTAPSDEAMVYDITKMKELGFNTLRKHVKIEPLRWYYHCDRLGMVVWQDMVNGGAINPVLMTYLPNIVPILTHKVRDSHYRLFARSDAKARTQWKQDCLDTVSHLGNCLCIGLWTIFNEGWGQFDSLAIAQAVQKEDPDRLIDPSSGWFDQGGPYVKSVHNYFRKLRVEKEKRPFLLSEYGGYSYAVAGHTYASSSFGYRSCRSQEQFAAEYRKLQKKICRLEKKGLSAAIYTQLSDIEEEVNGLLTYDRKCTKI